MQLNITPYKQSVLAKRRDFHAKNPTEAEQHIHALLTEAGERFNFQKGFFNGIQFYIVDFYLKKRKQLCLEIDGGYHERQKWYDENRDQFLTNVRGFRVLRITNQAALEMDSESLLKLITP